MLCMPRPCLQLLSDLLSWPSLQAGYQQEGATCSSLTPHTFSPQVLSSIVPPVQSAVSLLELGSGLLLLLPLSASLPHHASLLITHFSSWSDSEIRFKELPSPSHWHFSALAAKMAGSKCRCWTMPQLRHVNDPNAATSSFKLILSFFFSNYWESYLTFHLKPQVMSKLFLPKNHQVIITHTVMFKVRLSWIPGTKKNACIGNCIYLIKLTFR